MQRVDLETNRGNHVFHLLCHGSLASSDYASAMIPEARDMVEASETKRELDLLEVTCRVNSPMRMPLS